MKEKKIAYVGFAFLHHKNTKAGYQRIKEYVKYDYIFDCQKYFDRYFKEEKNPVSIFVAKVMSKIFGVKLFPWFILKIWWKGLFRRDIVFHFVYSESLFLPFPRYIGRNKAVCTVHQPLEVLEKWNMVKPLCKADSIILVGEAELEKFNSVIGKNNVVYIPHGISTDFYHPLDTVKKKRLLLTVGDWLRDFVFANKVYQKLLDMDPVLQIVVVSREKNRHYLTANPRLKFLCGISDEDLRNLYLESSVLFLPLLRYTANNSLLEAGACGCNIIISSDHPDNSYIPSQYVKLVKMDVDKTVSMIMNNHAMTYNMGLVKYIEDNYSWDVIGKKTESFLRSF